MTSLLPQLARPARIAPWAALLLLACDGGTPPPGGFDGGRRDGGRVDAGPLVDAEPPDTGLGADGGESDAAANDGGAFFGCRVDGESDVMVVGRDTDLGTPPSVSASIAHDRWAVVFSDDGDETRRLRVVSAPLDGSSPMIRATLEGTPEGARAPSILGVEAGWLVAWERSGGGIAVRPFDASFAPMGAEHSVSDAGGSPKLARLGASGAYVAWPAAGRLHGRPLAADGAPSEAPTDLGELPDDGSFSLHRHGSDGGALVAFGGAAEAPVRVRARRIGTSGTALAGTVMIGSTQEAEGAVAGAGSPPMRPDGVATLPGAVAFDARVGGSFREVRFALLDGDGSPTFGEFAVNPFGSASWGASVAPFRDGYAVAHRTRPMGGGFSEVRLGLMSRDSCELGRVDERLTVAVSGSEAGSPLALVARGDTLVLAWAESLTNIVEHRVAVGRCR